MNPESVAKAVVIKLAGFTIANRGLEIHSLLLITLGIFSCL